ncbi:hypothetical protein AAZX31_08G221600 [Glycine max]|uniref:Uncharacterized protein n=1 Tax=Glycine max TaxID=3847 RepID=I1KVV0_SOYBN|nr:uncharacterized protein LOC100777868 [Glycine max]XP_040874283.1 uncharacterized protein LOC100777868 [Glycine max]KAG5026222.1 hypothetical protein JHK86_022136 [Glycine max]KAH1052568.1 hypothetical protein GYH30_022074 [Glycine max]KAH1238168.1 hypothetical protein GmHk_08G022897 [Glycine max]KRH44684.1 hypothetical protein GLYMA_08G225400v4 [Glycine max]|eukprot:XP_003531780.1 uncharacterized protein LOC100777868 [Glycine max]
MSMMSIMHAMSIRSSAFFCFQINCSDSKQGRGFGENTNSNSNSNRIKTNKSDKGSTTKQSRPLSSQAPRLSSQLDGKSRNDFLDVDFEERLKAVRRSALEQKKAEEEKEFGAIDYGAPIPSDNKTIGLGTKIGVGVAVAVFGLVFAFGDFLPSGSVSPTEDSAVVNSKLSEEDKATLQSRLKEFEATLSNSPRDQIALEGAAVTLAELGEYARASSLLDDLTKEKPNDADVFRLLGEVKYELKDYEGSVAAYKSSARVSKDIQFEVLRGLSNSLLAAKKQEEAVQLLLAYREHLSSENLSKNSDSNPTDSQKLDPVQVELLLGKAYSDWGHVSDAVTVYDQLISTHPNDFRGYLAKGIILKENKNIGDAERMFIQARFFAPDRAKALVDRYSR